MNSERYARIKEAFAHARELGAEERSAYLDEVCAGDDELRREVEELLEADREHGNDPIDRALSDDEEFESGREPGLEVGRPSRIGKYRILGVCGSGGMGTVFEAEQDSPLRRVALKVIQSSTPRPDLLQRFRRETEILARLQHPGIAQIFEAGEFEQDGVVRPFFAMEFVDGAPLLDFAAKRTLDVTARLELFVRICNAIHYAHNQGVVHRDLKPDNIFVVESSSSVSTSSSKTAGAEPKILDFGVASLADPEAQITMATSAGQLLGSVPYMSPEQALGVPEDIEARSDVYALGVILFELLTGELPYDVKHRAIPDALHTIRYDEPSRLGSVDPGLRGDLETIVGKCLEKDKGRRYASVALLAEDVRRYQALEPITARPPSSWYQLKKFAQRNRAMVGGVATAAITIVVGAIVAVLFGIQATRHANLAREAQGRSDDAAYRANLSAASALLESDPSNARRRLEEVPEERRGWAWQMLSSALSSDVLEFGAVARRTPPWPYEPDPRFHNVPSEDMHLLASREEVVALSADDVFCVWRVRTGEVVRTFSAPAEVDVFAASREGNLLVAALESGRVVGCDPRDAEPDWTTWFESDARVEALAVAPAGDRVAIDRSNEIRFGTPDRWRVIETGERTYFEPPALEFSRDGSQLARLFGDVAVFDVATGEPVGQPMDGRQLNWAFAFAPDERRVAIGQRRRELRIFDPESGTMEFELLGHNFEINDVSFGEGNRRLVSCSRPGGTIRVWDLESREQIAVFDAPKTTRVELLDDDHVLSLSDGRFRLWTLTDRRVRELRAHDAHVFGTVFSGDGELLVSSAPWGDVLVWDAVEGTPLHRMAADLRDHFVFDRAGERVLHNFVYYDDRRSPQVAQPWTGGPKISLERRFRPRLDHAWSIRSRELRIQGTATPLEIDGFHVFRTEHVVRSASGGGRIRAFMDGEDLAIPRPEVAPDPGPHPQLLLGPRGFFGSIAELIVFDGPLADADARAVDSYLSARRRGESIDAPQLDRVLAHFRADEQAVVRDDEGRVLRWIARSDASLALDARSGPLRIRWVPETQDQPASVRFPDGHFWLEMPFPQAKQADTITVCWLGGFGDREVAPWNADWPAYSIETIDIWNDHDERIHKAGSGCAWSSDGRYDARILPGSKAGGAVIVREVATGHCVAHFESPEYYYLGVSFHPDARRIACGGGDGGIYVFDVETQELVQRIEAHTSHVFDVAYSPDGKLIASAGNDNALRLWDGDTGQPVLELPGHRSYVRCVNWSPDGTRLVSGSGDYGVRIWDATPRRERYAELLEHRALDQEVTAEVRDLHASAGGDRQAVAQAIQRRFADDAERRRAALRVLARME